MAFFLIFHAHALQLIASLCYSLSLILNCKPYPILLLFQILFRFIGMAALYFSFFASVITFFFFLLLSSLSSLICHFNLCCNELVGHKLQRDDFRLTLVFHTSSFKEMTSYL